MGPTTNGVRGVMVASITLGMLALAGCAPSDEAPRSTSPAAPQPPSSAPSPDASDGASRTTEAAPGEVETTSGSDPEVVPSLDVEVVMDRLSIPWDLTFLTDGTTLVTERGGRLLALDPDGQTRELSADLSQVVASGEAGLMGIATSPDYTRDHTIYLCHAAVADGGNDVRVTAWELDEDVTSAEQARVVVDGIPFTSGRHSGCRLLFTPDDELLIGTGDAADSPNPQDLRSLGGKTLIVTPEGEPTDADGHVEGADPRVYTYGHRNVQGLALRPDTDQVWEVEHGPDVDDEVNLLQEGGNYGWDPAPGYDEGVPMTDLDAFPDAIEAVWSSGDPTHATSGAVFLEGERWGAWNGALAVAELKGSGVTVLTLDGDEVVEEARIPELEGTYGRLRSLKLDQDGALWVTTSNGDGDVVLKVAPQG